MTTFNPGTAYARFVDEYGDDFARIAEEVLADEDAEAPPDDPTDPDPEELRREQSERFAEADTEAEVGTAPPPDQPEQDADADAREHQRQRARQRAKEDAYADGHGTEQEEENQRALKRLRANAYAREVEAAERADREFNPPMLLTLTELIAKMDGTEIEWRFEDLTAVGDDVLLNAAAKAGKTTLLINIVRALLTGEPLLGQFTTTPLTPGGVVLFIDTELGERRLSHWLPAALPPEVRDRVLVWPIKGRAGSLDIREPSVRARMIAMILDKCAGVAPEYLIVDVFAGWAAPLGVEENSNTEVRRLLEAFTSMREELGTSGLMLTHHAGHDGERSRGASAFRDWAGQWVTLTRGKKVDKDDDGRYFAARGRDVEVAESLMTYDPATRGLRIGKYHRGHDRRATARAKAADSYLETLLAVVGEFPGLGTRELRAEVMAALKDSGVESPNGAAVGEALRNAKDRGQIVNRGSGRARAWHLAAAGASD